MSEFNISTVRKFCNDMLADRINYIEMTKLLKADSVFNSMAQVHKFSAFSFLNSLSQDNIKFTHDVVISSEAIAIIKYITGISNLTVADLSAAVNRTVTISSAEDKLYYTILDLNKLQFSGIAAYADSQVIADLKKQLEITLNRLGGMVNYLKYAKVTGVLVNVDDANRNFYVLQQGSDNLYSLVQSKNAAIKQNLQICSRGFTEYYSMNSDTFLFDDSGVDVEIDTLSYTLNGHFEYKENDTVYSAETVNGVRYFPIFIASVIFRRKMICKDHRWYLCATKLSVKDYLAWLEEFLKRDILLYILRNLKDIGDYLTFFAKVNSVLMTYVIVKDFNLPAIMSFLYSFGGMATTVEEGYMNLIEPRFTTRRDASGIAKTLVSNGEITCVADGWQAVRNNVNQSNPFGKISIFSCNMKDYFGLTSFAYKQYAEMLQKGDIPTINHLFLGKTEADSLLEIDISGAKDFGLFITAGSRSGKGVLTLNLLAGLTYIGCPLIYADNKPDMSAMLWGIERDLNAKLGHVDGDADYARILALESTNPTSKYFGDKYNKLGRNSIRVAQAFDKYKSNLAKDVRGGLAYVKLLQLYLCSCVKLKAMYPDFNLKFIGIFDELNNATNRINSVFELFGVDTATLEIGAKVTGDNRKYAEYMKSIKIALDGGINADFGKCGTVYAICIAQDLRGASDEKGHEGAVVANGLIYSLVSFMSNRIYGKNGNIPMKADSVSGKDPLRLTVGTTNASVTAQMNVVNGVSSNMRGGKQVFGADEQVSRRFILKQGVNTELFAPMFTFPGNDIEIANPSVKQQYLSTENYSVIIDDDFISQLAALDSYEVSSDVGTFLSVKSKAKENVEAIIKNELVIQQQDGSYIKNEKIGFLGLLRMLFTHKYGEAAADAKILETLSMGYNICWSYLEKAGLVAKFGYTCIEEYLYDPRVETFFTNVQLNELYESGGGSATNTDDPVIVMDEEETSNGSTTSAETTSQNTSTAPNPVQSGMPIPPPPTGSGTGSGAGTGTGNTGTPPPFPPPNPTGAGTPPPNPTGAGTPPPNPTGTGTGTPPPNPTGTGTGTPPPNPTGTGTGTPPPNPTGAGTPPPNPTGTGTPPPNPTGTGTPPPNPTGTGTPPNPTGTGTGTPPPNPQQPQPSPFTHPTGYNDTSDNSYTEPFVDSSSTFQFRQGAFHDYQAVRECSIILVEAITKAMGNKDRVHTISIEGDGHILVNGIHINPSLTDDQIDTLPVDLRGKIRRGIWFELFYGKDLLFFRNLRNLIVEKTEVADKLCTEFGKPNLWKLRKAIRKRTKLQSFVVAGREVTNDPETMEYFERAQRGSGFATGVKNVFSGIGGFFSSAGDTCRTVRTSRWWNGRTGKFVRGVATVVGATVAMPLLGGIFGLLGFWGTVNAAIVGAGGVYNVVRKRKGESKSGRTSFSPPPQSPTGRGTGRGRSRSSGSSSSSDDAEDDE